MALTSDIDSNGWTQLTSSAGQAITVTVPDQGKAFTIYYIVSASDPGAGKTKPVVGDDAVARTLRDGFTTSFPNLDGTLHVWARTNAGVVRAYVTTAA